MAGEYAVRSRAASIASPVRVGVPANREPAVSRRGLIATLSSSGCPLVTVTAPAGYGKTTLLTQWASVEERAVAWVSLDRHDNDPIAMARRIIRSLSALGADGGMQLDHPGPWGADPDRSVRRHLRDAVARVAVPFLLVVDDANLVTDEHSIALLDGLVGEVPGGSQIAIAGRVEPLFVARRRVLAEVIEVGPMDLAFGTAAAVDVFAAAGLKISDVDGRRIVEGTEGWPAGVYLSAMVARNDAGTSSAVAPLSGSNRWVADYLLRSVFDGLRPELQQFLLGSCVLDEMSGPLCDHALDTVQTQRWLDELDRDNLFVVPLDDRREWYRYHALFREFLLGEFRRVRPDTDRVSIAQRASTWCRSNGRPDAAVEYLLRTDDSEELGPLLMETIRPAYLQGRVATVDRWLGAAGDETIGRWPTLAALASWIMALSGRAVAAERWAAVSKGAEVAGDVANGWTSYRSASAALGALLCADGVTAMARDAELVVELEPAWSVWRNTALWLLGQARELTGDRDAATRCYDEAIRLDEEGTRQPILVAPVSRALLAMDLGDWATAERSLDRASQIASVLDTGDYLTAALAHAASARLALRNGDLDRCEEQRSLAMASRHLATYAVPYAAVRLRVVLVDVHLSTGGRAAARELVREIDEVVALRPDLGVLGEDVARVHQLVDTPALGEAALTPAELRVLPYLPTHLTFAQIGAELFVSRHTVHSHAGSIYRKFGVSSRSEAVARAVELGFGQS